MRGGLYYRSHQTKTLTDKDTIVLADFDNKTGDPVFDDTLKQASTFPSAIALPERALRPEGSETLQLMARQPGLTSTREVARELCLRLAAKPLLAGSIANLGSQYVLGLKALNCTAGTSLAGARRLREQGEGAGRTGQSRLRACVANWESRWPRSRSSTSRWSRPQQLRWRLCKPTARASRRSDKGISRLRSALSARRPTGSKLRHRIRQLGGRSITTSDNQTSYREHSNKAFEPARPGNRTGEVSYRLEATTFSHRGSWKKLIQYLSHGGGRIRATSRP